MSISAAPLILFDDDWTPTEQRVLKSAIANKKKRPRDRLSLTQRVGESISIGRRRSSAAAGAAGAAAGAAAIAITLVGATHPAERLSLKYPHSFEVFL